MSTEKQSPAGLALDRDELLRIIVESSTDLAIFAMDSTRTVISWNVGAERLTGYAENEIVGRNGDVIFTPEDRDAGSPDREQEKALARRRRALAYTEGWLAVLGFRTDDALPGWKERLH